MTVQTVGVCGKCGEEHIDVGRVLELKKRYNYGYRVMSREVGYDGSHIRSVLVGKAVMSCKMDKALKRWMETAREFPWVTMYRPDNDYRLNRLERLKSRGHKVWLLEEMLDFDWVIKKCEGCGEIFVMLKAEPLCRKCMSGENKGSELGGIRGKEVAEG